MLLTSPTAYFSVSEYYLVRTACLRLATWRAHCTPTTLASLLSPAHHLRLLCLYFSQPHYLPLTAQCPPHTPTTQALPGGSTRLKAGGRGGAGGLLRSVPFLPQPHGSTPSLNTAPRAAPKTMTYRCDKC